MCKILMIPGIKDSKRKETNAFIFEMGLLMSKHNTDGIGYAAIDKDGALFGERWFNNNHFTLKPNESDTSGIDDKRTVADNIISTWGKALKTTGSTSSKIWSSPTSKNYNRFGVGELDSDVSAITLHTRMATCDKTLGNVHPFVDNDTSVIHNGVISNSKQFDLKLSTCDSESILISYLSNNVGVELTKAQDMADKLYGYYACGVFARDATGARILDVFKGNNHSLSIAYIFELETYVLASSDIDIRAACDTLGFTHGGTKDIENNYITRINPFTGEIIAQETFTSQSNYWTDKPAYVPSIVANNVKQFPTKPTNASAHSSEYYEMLKLPPTLILMSERAIEEFETRLSMEY